MPVPRRKAHHRVVDTVTVIPVYHTANPPRENTILRCQRCKCRLAADQPNHHCSPCQRAMNDTPDWIGDLLT